MLTPDPPSNEMNQMKQKWQNEVWANTAFTLWCFLPLHPVTPDFQRISGILVPSFNPRSIATRQQEAISQPIEMWAMMEMVIA